MKGDFLVVPAGATVTVSHIERVSITYDAASAVDIVACLSGLRTEFSSKGYTYITERFAANGIEVVVEKVVS